MMFDVHPDLRRYVSVTFFVSAGVGVFGVLFLILGLTGVHGSAKGPSWPFVIFGVVAILSGCVGMTIVPRHYRYASRVVASVTTPQCIVLELESDSDSTSLYAMPIDSAARQRAHCVDTGEQKKWDQQGAPKIKGPCSRAGWNIRPRALPTSDATLRIFRWIPLIRPKLS
jgi:hypothetical protein